MLKQYYQLTKPGIIKGNLLTATAGYFLAAGLHPTFSTFVGMLVGLALIIAAGCVFNNYMDRSIDKLMQRTQQRALVSGEISGRRALIFATTLGVVGTLALAWLTNPLTTAIALFGLFAYVILYGIGKRKTVHGTLIGSISGAVPPVVGYAAATNRLDTAALLLFIILVCWQMPHFYAIAMYRAKDYAKANIPVLPVVKGMRAARIQILAYICLLIIASGLLTIFNYTGFIYLTVVSLICLAWLRVGVLNFDTLDDEKWGKKMFLFSLIVIMSLSIMIPVGALLP